MSGKSYVEAAARSLCNQHGEMHIVGPEKSPTGTINTLIRTNFIITDTMMRAMEEFARQHKLQVQRLSGHMQHSFIIVSTSKVRDREMAALVAIKLRQLWSRWMDVNIPVQTRTQVPLSTAQRGRRK